MRAVVRLQSKKKGEINRFLSKYYDTDLELDSNLKWEKKYDNPIDISDIIGAYVDSFDSFNIKMWISLDKNIFVKISEHNADEIIRYLFERYPY